MTKAKRFWNRNKFGFAFVAPLLIFLAVFSIFPFFYGIIMSFFDVNTTSNAWTFVGFGNFVELFQDQVFWQSCKTMMILLVPRLLINVFIPFIYAELIIALSSKKAQKIYRVLTLLPIVAPGVVGLLIWKNIYATDGLINSFIKLFNPSAKSIDWLNSDSNPTLTYLALIFLGFPWVGGTSILIYLSGLMGINDSVYEASRIDGCSTMRRIFKVDMPLCLGQFRYFLIFGIINGLQDYGSQIVLYQNFSAPDYVYVPGFYLYKQAYVMDRSGYAASIGVVLFLVIAFFTALGNYLTKEKKSRKIKGISTKLTEVTD